MDEGRLEQLEKMFPDGFIILVPRKKKLKDEPLPLALYYMNPSSSGVVDQVVDDIVFALSDDYWGNAKKNKPS